MRIGLGEFGSNVSVPLGRDILESGCFGRSEFHDLLPSWNKYERDDLTDRGGYRMKKSNLIATR